MEHTENDLLAGLGVLAWLVAAVVYRAIHNPFEWWLAFREAVEFVPFLVSGGSLGEFVSAHPSPETTAVLAGWFGIVGWVSLGAVFIREDARLPFALNALFVPLLAFVAVLVWRYRLRYGPDRTEPDSPA